jgi:hypothetical protein
VHHFRAQFVLPGAAAVDCPLKSRVVNLSGLGEVRQLRQHPTQDRFIAPALMGWAEGAAHRMIDEDRARRRNLANNIEGRARQQRRNALIFDDMGDETDGLMTEGSIGNEQCKIDFRFDQVLRDGGRQFGFNFLLASDPAHDRDMKGRQFTDDALLHQRRQRRARENYFRILLRHRADARVMINNYLAGAGVGENPAITQVFPWNERFLVRQPKGGTA